jgi:poly(3-hydroxybutyrate) depolymerase
MWRAILAASVIALPAAAQPSPPPQPATSSPTAVARTLDVDGVARRYWVIAPPGARRPAPTLIVLHGGSTRDGLSSLVTGLPDLGAGDGVVTVYPEGLIAGWNDGRRAPAFRKMRGEPDDVGFLRRVSTSWSRRELPIRAGSPSPEARMAA